MPPSYARRCSGSSSPLSCYTDPQSTPAHHRREPSHEQHRTTITVTVTERYSVAATTWSSHPTISCDAITTASPESPTDTPVYENMNTPAASSQSKTTFRSGIVGGCVGLAMAAILVLIIYLCWRHRWIQINALRHRHCDDQRKSPLPSPPFPSPSCSVIHIRPLTPPHTAYGAPSSDLELPPAYSSLCFSPSVPRPQEARRKTSSSVIQSVRLYKSGLARPQLRIDIPHPGAT